MAAIDDIATERMKQTEVEGYSSDIDDLHMGQELICAALVYTILNFPVGAFGSEKVEDSILACWPWGSESLLIGDERSNLIKAAAFIVAEIDRLDRAWTR